MKRYLWGLAALLSLTASALADDADRVEALFNQLDADDDGVVTADEVNEEQARHFHRLLRNGDADENGELTRDEFREAIAEEQVPVEEQPERPAGSERDEQRITLTPEMVERLDANSDGTVTLEEIPEDDRPRFERLFERLDIEEIEVSRLRELAERQQEMLATGGDNPPSDRPRGESDRPDGDRPEGDRPREDGDNGREEGDRPMDRDQPREDGDRGEGDRPMGRDFQGPEFVRRLDTNGDRRLSQAEIENLSEVFGELDRNDDGQLDMGELMGFPMDNVDGPDRGGDRPMGDAPWPDGAGRGEEGGGDFNPREFFSRIDADGNGFISEDEAPERLRPDFEAADTNDDNQISPEELMSHLGGGRGEGGDRPPQGPEDFFANLDRNDDGFITTDEMPEGRSEEMLNRADADDDGKISLDEVRGVFGGGRSDGDRPGGDRPDRERPEAEGEREGDGDEDRPDRERENDRPDAR